MSIGELVETLRQKLLRAKMAQIKELARNFKIKGRSSMSRTQLIEAILREIARRLRRGG